MSFTRADDQAKGSIRNSLNSLRLTIADVSILEVGAHKIEAEFSENLKKEYSYENLDFLKDVLALLQISHPKELARNLSALYQKYHINTNTNDLDINLSDASRLELVKAMDEATNDNKKFTFSHFKKALCEAVSCIVKLLMFDKMPRFEAHLNQAEMPDIERQQNQIIRLRYKAEQNINGTIKLGGEDTLTGIKYQIRYIEKFSELAADAFGASKKFPMQSLIDIQKQCYKNIDLLSKQDSPLTMDDMQKIGKQYHELKNRFNKLIPEVTNTQDEASRSSSLHDSSPSISPRR